MPEAQTLPGMELPNIPEVTAAAKAYAEKRDARMALLKEEVDLKNALISLMHQHGLLLYQDTNEDPPVLVELKTSEKVKVKIGSGEDGEAEE